MPRQYDLSWGLDTHFKIWPLPRRQISKACGNPESVSYRERLGRRREAMYLLGEEASQVKRLPLDLGSPGDLLLWDSCRQVSAVSGWGLQDYKSATGGPVCYSGWPHPGALARPQASWTGGPMKGQQLTIKVVVSDHIDLFSFSFCPFTVWLESVLILFVNFSHH